MLFVTVATAMLSSLLSCGSVVRAGTCKPCPRSRSTGMSTIARPVSHGRYCPSPMAVQSCRKDMESIVEEAKSPEYAKLQLTPEAEQMIDSVRLSVESGIIAPFDSEDLENIFKN